MKAYKNIFALLLFAGLFVCPLNITAQNDLTNAEKEQLKDRVKTIVEDFQQYISDIVNTKLSDNQRRNSITSALALFMGKGGAYWVENEYGTREPRNPVQIQISSVNSTHLNKMSVAKYLNNQFNNVHKYGEVKVESADIVRVDNIYKTADGKYQAVAYFSQKYIAFQDGKIVYSDITGKKVIVYIDAIDTPGGTTWDAKLGDIYVTDTKRL